MPAQKTNLQELINKTAYLFRTCGYHNTSIFDIATYCNLSKASVYHYMPSKEALGMAVIQHVHRETRDHVFKLAYTPQLSEQERLAQFTQALEEFFANREGGCLIGNLALEISGVIPAFEALICDYFNEWAQAISHLLKTKYGEQTALEIAHDSVAQTQGAVMLQRLFRDESHLKRIIAKLRSLL